MIKKILPIVLCFCLVCGINSFAANNEAEMPAAEMSEAEIADEETQITKNEPVVTDNIAAEPLEQTENPQNNQEIPENGMANNQGRNSAMNENMQGFPMMPENMNGMNGNMQGINQNAQTNEEGGFTAFLKTYSTPVTSVLLLIPAFLFVIFYKRKRY